MKQFLQLAKSIQLMLLITPIGLNIRAFGQETIPDEPIITIRSPRDNNTFRESTSLFFIGVDTLFSAGVSNVNYYVNGELLPPYNSDYLEYFYLNVFGGLTSDQLRYDVFVEAVDSEGTVMGTDAITVFYESSSGSRAESSQVSQGSDDAFEESGTGIVTLDSDPIPLQDGLFKGFRFVSGSIPPNVRIDTAYLEFTAASDANDTVQLAFRGEMAIDANSFEDAPFNILQRNLTSEVVWSTVEEEWLRGNRYHSADLSPIIQEMVTQDGWSMNSPIVVFAYYSGSLRTIKSFETSPAEAPKLHIEYSILNEAPVAEFLEPTPVDGEEIEGDTVEISVQATDRAFYPYHPGPSGVWYAEFFLTNNQTGEELSERLDTDILSERANTGLEVFNVSFPVEGGEDYTIRVVVWDLHNESTEFTRQFSVFNEAPIVTITSPGDNDEILFGQKVKVSAVATDDHGIARVEFYANGVPIGFPDDTLPYEVDWDTEEYGSGSREIRAVAFDNKGNSSEAFVVVNVIDPEPIIVQSRINNRYNDVEQKADDGQMTTGSSDLEMVLEGKNNRRQWVGLRYDDLSIPPGALIKNAYIQFTADEKDSLFTNLTIQGHLSTDSEIFSTSRYNVSEREKTNSTAEWSPPAWTEVGAAGADQRTSDLKEVVQEMVDQEGWSENSPLTFIVFGSGKRTAESFDGQEEDAALLNIEYTILPDEQSNAGRVSENSQTFENDPSSISSTPIDVKVFPIPAKDELNILMEEPIDGVVEIRNLSGQLILIHEISSRQKVKLNLSNTTKRGIHFLLIKTEDGRTFNRKFIVE